jgi:AcrR family transcriptional regulator
VNPSTRAPEASGRRAVRHARTKAAVLEAAWRLAEDDGVAGITLSRLAAQVDLTQPALYTYFASKNDLYDAMFAESFASLLNESVDGSDRDPAAPMLAFIAWCKANPRRFELMFQRPIPGFAPSAESFALSVEFDRRVDEWLKVLGIRDRQTLDLIGAVPLGLVSLQLANEPGGDRWTRLAPRALRLLLDGLDSEGKSLRRKSGGAKIR